MDAPPNPDNESPAADDTANGASGNLARLHADDQKSLTQRGGGDKVKTRPNRVQHTVAAALHSDHYDLEPCGDGWSITYRGVRTVIGKTFAEAFRNLPEFAPQGVPGLISGAC